MRKVISSLLSILIILNTFGFNLVVIFLIQESSGENLEILEEHPETITSDKLVAFSLKTDRIRMVNEREISFNKEMYDIVFKKDVGGDTILYCVSDKEDTRLHTVFRSLNDLSENPLSVPDNFVSTILKNLLKNYLPPGGDKGAAEIISEQLFSIIDIIPQSVIPEKIYPPPQTQIISC